MTKRNAEQGFTPPQFSLSLDIPKTDFGEFNDSLTDNHQSAKTGAGFTLVEMLISIALFLIISIGLVALASNLLTASGKQSGLVVDSDQARKLAFNIMNELRNAQTSSTGAYALATADNQTLMFYSNIDADSVIERVRYFTQNGKLYKNVLKPVGNPLVYNPANETVLVVQDNVANGGSPLFYYYDGAYDGVNGSAISQPVSVTMVKFVKLDLKIYNKAGVQNTNFYTITASGSVRNLKTNLADPGLPDYFYQLSLNVSPVGAGSVSVSPSGPNYPEHTLANLTAYANLGYGFSSWSGNVTNPNTASTTIMMDNNESVTANLQALPQTLTGSISNKTGSQGARRWTLRVDNPNSYAVNSASLYSFDLSQTAGPTCTPTLTAPAAFPASIGNISAGGYRTIQVTINFNGCNSSTRFTANFSFAGNNGANWGSASVLNQAQ